jgi:hypothetical protein
MKRGMTTVLAAVTFIAGHFAATACQASMSIPAPRETKAEHSCCGHHGPAAPKAPAPKACCCVDGAHLAVVVEKAPVADPAECVAPDDVTLVPVLLALPVFTGGRAPPGPAPGVPLYTLHATLLI